MRSSVPVLAVSHKFYAIRVAVDIAPFSGSRFAKRGQSKSSISLAFSGNKNCITARRDVAWAQKRKNDRLPQRSRASSGTSFLSDGRF
jgi:hypothetical protein